MGAMAVPLLLAWLAVVGGLYLGESLAGDDMRMLVSLVGGMNLAGGIGLGAVFSSVVKRPRQSVPRAYSADLFGAAAAALLVPLVLVPFAGNVAAAGTAFVVLAAGAAYGRRRR